MKQNLFTSESVTCGHPDKVCDQIADRVLDSLLEQDPASRVACEVTCVTDAVHIFGEVTTQAQVDYDAVARQVIREIGYTNPGVGFDADTCGIRVDLHEQSPDGKTQVTVEYDEFDIPKRIAAVVTDQWNEGTASIQYVMRTQKDTGTFWSRIKAMFADLWLELTAVFGEA